MNTKEWNWAYKRDPDSAFADLLGLTEEVLNLVKDIIKDVPNISHTLDCLCVYCEEFKSVLELRDIIRRES